MADIKVVRMQYGITQHNGMNQDTIYNPNRFRRHRTSTVPSLQSKCYFHINKTTERPKTLELQIQASANKLLNHCQFCTKQTTATFLPKPHLPSTLPYVIQQ
jgi:hypothetical protein